MSQHLEQRPKSKSNRQVSCDASTEVKSKLFMKQMLALPISHIVYLRGIFGEEHFADRFVGDLAIKMLRDSKDENAHLLIEWMRGCFDALDKDYLKSVSLTIHDPADPRDNPIESYTFSVSLNSDHSRSLSMQRNGEDLGDAKYSEKNVKAAAIDCLTRLCDTISELEMLPDEVVLNMELSYYDEKTPKDYEPVGFRPSSRKSRPEAKEVGEVETKYHRLRVKVYTRPKISERSAISCNEDPIIGVVSPTVRPMETESREVARPASADNAIGGPRTAPPPLPSPAAAPAAQAHAVTPNSTVDYGEEEAMETGEPAAPANVPSGGKGSKRGKGKAPTAAGKRGGKRKPGDDSPSEKNSEASKQRVLKRVKK